MKLQAGSDVNRAESHEYFIWTVDKHQQKKNKEKKKRRRRRNLTAFIYLNKPMLKWKSLFIHLEGIPDGGMNPTGSVSLSNVPLSRFTSSDL